MRNGAEADQPRYLQIADELRAAIGTGEYTAGDRLPGENELATRHGVAPMTARKALNTLKAEGLVESRRGAGFFVRVFQPIRRRGIQRLARDQWGAGNSIWSTDESREVSIDQITVAETTAPPAVASVLELGEDLACRRSRRYLVEGRPVMIATSYLPAQLVAGTAITQPDTGPGGTFARLGELGLAPVHHREEVRFGSASAETARRLELAPGSPVINIVRTSYTADRRPVEVNQMALDAGAYVLEYEFDA
jgi:GntR family transcriptional regulator